VTDPLRMREDRPDEPASILLDHARGDAPPDGFRGRLAAGLGLGIAAASSASTAAGSTAAAVAAASKGLTWGKLLIGLGLVSLAGGVAWKSATDASNGPRRLQNRGAIRAANPVPRPAAGMFQAPPQQSLQAQSIAKAESPTFSARVGKGAAHSNTVRPQKKPALADEVIALDEARRALAGDDSAGALTRLGDYDRKFPNARLGPEATILRIEALLARGDHTRAAQLAAQFRAAFPGSPHTRRVDSLLARAKSAAPAKR
jgi:hypothetical protein